MGLVVLVVTVGFWPGLSYPEATDLPLSSGGLPAASSFESIPPTPEGDEIQLGYHLIVNTQKYARSFVGNGLSCSNCHLDAGRKVGAGTYVGVLYAYPRYRERAGRRISLKDRINGQQIFHRHCAGWHGLDGHDTMVAPPLWGPRSFNFGAGLARVSKAAAFIHVNMPFTQPGVLSHEEAYNVAAFMNSHARPDYAPKVFDWPNGEKPADSPY